MAAEHCDDCALVLRGFGDRVYYVQEIPRYQNVGQGFQESAEAAITFGGRDGCELGGDNFVGAPLDRNGANFREIGFRENWLGRRALRLRSRRFSWARTGAAVTAYGFGDGK